MKFGNRQSSPTSSWVICSAGVRLSSPNVLPGCVRLFSQLGYSEAGLSLGRGMLFTASANGLASAAEEALPALAAKPTESHGEVLVRGPPRRPLNRYALHQLQQYLCEAMQGWQTRGCDSLQAACTTADQLTQASKLFQLTQLVYRC